METHKGKTDQIVGEAFAKAAQIIITSRVYETSRVLARSSRAWFNLEVEEAESAKRELDAWRRDFSRPLVIQIYLQPWGGTSQQGQQRIVAAPSGDTVETLLEQWVVSYRPPPPSAHAGSSASGIAAKLRYEPPAVYKRLVVLLRGLYSYVRLLPAYRLYRACKRIRGADFALRYNLLAGPRGAGAVELPPGRLQHFALPSVDTPYGVLACGVHYQPATKVSLLERTTAPQPLPQIIADYIDGGGPPGRQLRSTLSASLYERNAQLPDPSSSPPVTTGAGILRGVQRMTSQAAGVLGRRGWGLPATTAVHGGPTLRTQSMPTSGGGEGVPLHPLAPGRPPATPPGCSPRAAPQPLFSPGGFSAATPPKHPSSLGLPARGGLGGGLAAAATAAGAGRPGGSAAGNPLARGTAAHSTGAAAQAQPQRQRQGDDKEPGGSCPRKSSAPVCIPHRSPHRYSSNDLCTLANPPGSSPPHAGRSARSGAPASAPASAAPVHVPLRPAGRPSFSPSGLRGAAAAAPPPALPSASAPPPLAPHLRAMSLSGVGHPGAGDADVAMAASFASSCHPLSCSPQLPFAFTPSGQSLGSFSDVPTAAPMSWAMPVQPSPPVASRDLAALRRGAGAGGGWGGRAGSPEGGQPMTFSSGGGHDSLGSSLMSSSTPRPFFGLPAQHSPSPGANPFARPAYARGPAGAPGGSPALTGGVEESESECLPFVLDGEGPACGDGDAPLSARSVPAALFADFGSGHSGGSGAPGAEFGAGSEADAAVCAYLRQVQEAAPLAPPALEGAGMRGMTLEAALAHVAAVRGRLQSVPRAAP